MEINVIGGSGFIGSRLVRRLLARPGFKVSILDKVRSEAFPELVHLVDVRSVESLRSEIAPSSIVINLAAEHRDDVRPLSLYDEVNVDGAKNICSVAREKNINKIIFTSSVAVYGFAPVGTDETGQIAPFNEYGRTKYAAEKIFNEWQAEDPGGRTLVILRPTVVFGERNRGNVYNLLRQIAVGTFLMIGKGRNSKSMAYVENVAAFIEFSLSFGPGVHVYNYVDKPDFTMNALVEGVNRTLGRSDAIRLRIPMWCGMLVGRVFDMASFFSRRRYVISAIRVKKFCSDTAFSTSIDRTGFVAPVSLLDALIKTVQYEFVERHEGEQVFYTE